MPFLLRDPHVLLVGHDVGQDGAAEKDHVAPPRRVFDPDFEFLAVGGQVSVPCYLLNVNKIQSETETEAAATIRDEDLAPGIKISRLELE